MSGAEGTVVHAYGLVDPTFSVHLPEGIDGALVSVVKGGEVAVLASELSAEAYGAEVWRAHGEDPRWLEHVASQHHAVLQAVVEQVDVLPLRLPGIHDDLATLERVLHDQHHALEAAFARVRGHVELGAKVYVVADTKEAEVRERPASGREYLARRSAEATSREESRLRRQSKVLDAHEAMAQASTHAVVNPTQDAALSGRAEPMVLNAAYLVARDHLDRFIDLAEQLGEQLRAAGMTLEVTGPWPPYNFADGHDETEPAVDDEIRAGEA